jgi:hypothetical protein
MTGTTNSCPNCNAAVLELERLRKENARLQEAIEQFVNAIPCTTPRHLTIDALLSFVGAAKLFACQLGYECEEGECDEMFPVVVAKLDKGETE